MLRAGGADGRDWLMIGGDYAGARYSPLREIDTGNVDRLQLRSRNPFDGESFRERIFGWADSQRVWYRPRTWRLQTRRWLGGSERQTSTPVVVGAVAYYTGSYNRVLAVEVPSGRPLWTYRHRMARAPLVCCGPHNRGVAVAGDLVYVGTLDAHLLALDRRTGSLVWDAQVADPAAAYSITAAPLVAEGLVIIGVSGADYGVRGFLDAYDARTGARRWRFWTIPSPEAGGWWGRWTPVSADGDSLPRDLAREKRDSARFPDSWRHGGGSVWMTPSYDPAMGLIYAGTGNPAPALDDALRPGDNLYSSSIVALDVRTGTLRWYRQISPHDMWDRDASNPIVLFSARVGDSLVPALAQANRTGWVYVLDRRNGARLLRSDAFVPQKNVFERPSTTGTLSYPSVGGGNVSAPSAYSPLNGLLFVPGVHRPSLLRLDQGARQPGRSYYGGQDASAGEVWGNVSAVDLRTGRIRWQRRTDTPPISTGALATAGGLVFYGDGSSLVALDAATGRVLRKLDMGCPTDGTPVTFLERGRQYLALVCRSGLATFELGRRGTD
jgi:alcohol dehydrogenase (cytochrome c)